MQAWATCAQGAADPHDRRARLIISFLPCPAGLASRATGNLLAPEDREGPVIEALRATENRGAAQVPIASNTNPYGTLHDLFTSLYPALPAKECPACPQPELPHGFLLLSSRLFVADLPSHSGAPRFQRRPSRHPVQDDTDRFIEVCPRQPVAAAGSLAGVVSSLDWKWRGIRST